MYQKIVKSLTEYITDEMHIPPPKKDRLRFGIEIFLSTVITLIFSLVPAFILGITRTVIIVLLAGAFLKTLTGGIHLKGPFECAIFTSIFANMLALISNNYYKIIYKYWQLFISISFIYILLSLLLWSPADVPEKPITDKGKIKFFKTISILFSLIILVIVILIYHFTGSTYGLICTGLISGLFFQALTISPLFYKIRKFYYLFKHNIKHIFKRGCFK